MRAKPILFNTEMVRAILDGKKTATRRVIKPQPVKKENLLIKEDKKGKYIWGWVDYGRTVAIKDIPFPYQSGNILYVRETWAYLSCSNCEGDIDIGVCSKRKKYREEPIGCYVYKADDNNFEWEDGKSHWKPSIHMPKEAARIWLKVTDVRVERLQDMKVIDALEEGIDTYRIMDYSFSSERAVNAMNEGVDLGLLRFALIKYSDLWDSNIKKTRPR